MIVILTYLNNGVLKRIAKVLCTNSGLWNSIRKFLKINEIKNRRI